MATISSGALGAREQLLPGGTANQRARKSLKTAGITWLVVAVFGQFLMAVYVAGFYLRAALAGDWERWNRVLPVGHIDGDTAGNLVLLLHLMFVAVVVGSGALQLLPALRRHWPQFHHWNGRLYLVSALVMSLGGLYLTWSRESPTGDRLLDIAISINALLILGCAAMALRHALARRIDRHRRWALRLFLVMSGVWFFRVGLMFWLLVNQGPVGFDPESFSGPFLTFLGFAQYLLPLAILELYFRAQDGDSFASRVAMTACLGVLTLVTASGIFGASLMMWLPRLAGQ